MSERLIFDIGANIGEFADKCLSEYLECKVVLVEPNDALIPGLEKRFENKNVQILNFLVGNSDKSEVDFYLCKDGSSLSTANVDWINKSRFSSLHNWDRVVSKQVITLDTLIDRYGSPDLIKIDTEGYEFQVIKGLSTKQNEICFEWAEELYDVTNQCCAHLERLGYKEFGFTDGEDYLVRPDKYSSWGDCELHNDINISRQTRWGMVWAK